MDGFDFNPPRVLDAEDPFEHLRDLEATFDDDSINRFLHSHSPQHTFDGLQQNLPSPDHPALGFERRSERNEFEPRRHSHFLHDTSAGVTNLRQRASNQGRIKQGQRDQDLMTSDASERPEKAINEEELEKRRRKVDEAREEWEKLTEQHRRLSMKGETVIDTERQELERLDNGIITAQRRWDRLNSAFKVYERKLRAPVDTVFKPLKRSEKEKPVVKRRTRRKVRHLSSDATGVEAQEFNRHIDDLVDERKGYTRGTADYNRLNKQISRARGNLSEWEKKHR